MRAGFRGLEAKIHLGEWKISGIPSVLAFSAAKIRFYEPGQGE